MALKKKIDKAAFDKLSKELQSEYVEKDGSFVLDVDGEEDTGALKRAKDRESQLRKEAEKKAEELQEQLDGISDTNSRKKGDIETLEKSWKKKTEEIETASNAKIAKLTAHTTKTLIDGTAAAIAAKISTVPGLMAKAVRERLSVDFDGDEPTLRILGADGKPSALTIEQLSQEFVANKDYSGIIIGSKSSGGGAAKDGFQKSNASGGNSTDKPALLAKMSPRELADQITATREANKE